MSDTKAKTGQRGGIRPQKQHFCPEHDKVCQAMKVMPGKRMVFVCPKGCSLPKTGTNLK